MHCKRTKNLAVMAVALAAGIAVSGASTSRPAPAADQPKPLVVVSNTGLTYTRTFNPYTHSLGGVVSSTDLYYEPLLMFNITNPAQAPINWLATGYTWSDGGKTLTFRIRQDVRWSDGKPFTARDVAFTYTMLKNNPELFFDDPVISATAPDARTAVLTFTAPRYGDLFRIGSVFIVPEHIWKNVANPATYADADPVGTGPYTLTQFSTQKFTLTKNPRYWQARKVRVPEISYPNYATNDAASAALESGQVDYAGIDVSNVQQNFLGKDPAHFRTWTASQPWFYDSNVVTLWLNVTRAPLDDPQVRRAISAGIDRQQLSVQGETGYEPPATSSSGLLLPTDASLLSPAYSNDLKPVSDSSKVTSILTADGWAMVNGKWAKNGQTIKFAIEDPSAYTDYATDAQLIATGLNAQGFDVSFNGVDASTWYSDYPAGNFDAMIHWSNQGPGPITYFEQWLDTAQLDPKGSSGDYGQFNSPQAQQALTQFASASDPAGQQAALSTLEQIVSTQAPVIPLLYGATWYEYSTKNYTGWPSAANSYNDPIPDSPFMLNTVLHLRPISDQDSSH
jgi:peptide/nickel transport system substrate-binding protein